MAQLYFSYSAMNAGKSAQLLTVDFNYKERGMNTLIFTSAHDNRYGLGKVTSRIGIEAEAVLFNNNTDMLETIQNQKEISCVLVDEAQFMTKYQVYQLTEAVDKLKIPVMCYGLRTDFRGELFEGSQWLLAWADKLIELKTVCTCGKKATFTSRNTGLNTDQVCIGGNDIYESVCRKHFNNFTVKVKVLEE